jgi:2-dehydro-3-deoxyphosphogluconate aldolase/(4S)-4-hydroxy-2-oxoglutarate aldolase
MSVQSIMATGPVIPVVIIEDSNDAIPLADALTEGGIGTIEITLRSDAAIDAITKIATNRPQMIVGAGTVLTSQHMEAVKNAGADFVVSPGAYPELISSAQDCGMAFLPGAATASEMMALMAQGITAMKFFPATVAGGPKYLEALASPLADAVFCPTGGITANTASDWLSLPNVICVGGSWVAPTSALAQGDFDTIISNAKACSKLMT